MNNVEIKRQQQDENLLRGYILSHTAQVLKPPRSFIHYPFIDPGSAYDGNVWDWDTFWSAYGFLNLADQYTDPAMKARLLRHAKGNVQNFIDHQLPDGYIPMMIEVAKWPEPYLNLRHKEGVPFNMHKPFLCSQICLVSEAAGDYGWAAGYFENLEKYFACYDRSYYNEHCGLYVWHDDIMIGMDNDPATFGRGENATANIFLNSFLCVEFTAMAKLCKKYGRAERAEYYLAKKEALRRAIQAECWDRRDQFFYSADADIHTRAYDWFHQGLGAFWKTLPIKIRVWSGILPLYAGIATPEQAAAMAKHMADPDTFACAYGITTLARDEKMFSLTASINPSNWLGPVWLVANYLAFRGLLNYGFRTEAEEICRGSLRLLGRDLETTGTLHEYYNPFTGAPIMNGGFINWNVLALNMAEELRGKPPLCDAIFRE